MKIERSIEIDAPAEKVYEIVMDAHRLTHRCAAGGVPRSRRRGR